MTKTICILGRQPALGRAELESLFGADVMRPIADYAVLLDIEPASIDFTRLGGTVKFAKLLTILDTTQWNDIEKFLKQAVPQHAAELPEGKLKLGLSTYGMDVPVTRINATALSVKKVIKAAGRSVRVVPNTEPALNSAQVLHNGLTRELGWELIFIKDDAKTVVAQNIAEQDIDAYAARDQARPKRDSKVGMLPPKLAQTLINLGSGQIDLQDPACGPGTSKGKTVLDPFCGTGVVLQEAALMGYDAYGSDIDERMVEYSQTNLDWLGEHFAHPPFTYWVEAGDATTFQWLRGFDFVASETYLGRPFSSPPAPELLEETMQTTNLIFKKFLHNIHDQTKPGFRLALAVPAWSTKNGFKHLRSLDNLAELGYNRLSFVHAEDKDLIYHREGQIVGRELIVLVRAKRSELQAKD